MPIFFFSASNVTKTILAQLHPQDSQFLMIHGIVAFESAVNVVELTCRNKIYFYFHKVQLHFSVNISEVPSQSAEELDINNFLLFECSANLK